MWFVPGSALTDEQLKTMPTQVASRMPAALLRVTKRLAPMLDIPVLEMQAATPNIRQRSLIDQLGHNLSTHGSDKSTTHDYHTLYGLILSVLGDSPRILEIGLGSNNLEIASNMGVNGKPGASLRAFRDFAPSATVHGADIDSTIKVEGCKTFTVDQTNPASFSTIRLEGEPLYDLIIDDGLHSPDANLNTLDFALSCLAEGGFIVIEDITPASLAIWRTVQHLFLSTSYQSFLIKARSAFVFVVSNRLSLPGMW